MEGKFVDLARCWDGKIEEFLKESFFECREVQQQCVFRIMLNEMLTAYFVDLAILRLHFVFYLVVHFVSSFGK